MLIQNKCRLIVSVCLFTFFNISAQFNSKLNLETGVYLNGAGISEASSIYKLFGNLAYHFRGDNKSGSIGIKLRPQILNSDFHSLKYALEGKYQYQNKSFSWRSNLLLSEYNLDLSLFNPLYTIFSFFNNFEFNSTSNYSFGVNAGYSYQGIYNINSIKTDYIHVNPLLNVTVNNYSKLGFGIYVQKFDTKTQVWNDRKLYSTGWKFGPNLKVRYLRKFIFNAEYKFLTYNSNMTVYPSYEHNIHMLTGTLINKHISIFLLVEFNFIRTKFKTSVKENNPIFFFPTQNDNEIYLKISHKIKKELSAYIKMGYFRENLYLDDLKLDGMNFLLGIQISN